MAKDKIDLIHDKYYGPLEGAELWAEVLFYVSATFSLIGPLVDKTTQPELYSWMQILFVLSVAAVFTLDWIIRFYFAPRAHARRYQDFLSSAYGIDLAEDRTVAYYNTDSNDTTQRLAAQLLENCLHSKDTVQRMAQGERAKIVVYGALFIVAVLNRATDLSTIALISQIVFSEQVLSKWLRTEWLRGKFETIYDELFRLFQSKPEPVTFAAMSHELLGRYESAKANACVTLSSKIFNRYRETNMAQWERIKKTLGI